ncbi:hypothetical protein DFH09DRAFT_1307881 [Mycena vulgaris]|nr:hypothetical protein DFH09DRAFT_1307881 [Mycena vulgaris]
MPLARRPIPPLLLPAPPLPVHLACDVAPHESLHLRRGLRLLVLYPPRPYTRTSTPSPTPSASTTGLLRERWLVNLRMCLRVLALAAQPKTARRLVPPLRSSDPLRGPPLPGKNLALLVDPPPSRLVLVGDRRTSYSAVTGPSARSYGGYVWMTQLEGVKLGEVFASADVMRCVFVLRFCFVPCVALSYFCSPLLSASALHCFTSSFVPPSPYILAVLWNDLPTALTFPSPRFHSIRLNSIPRPSAMLPLYSIPPSFSPRFCFIYSPPSPQPVSTRPFPLHAVTPFCLCGAM